MPSPFAEASRVKDIYNTDTDTDTDTERFLQRCSLQPSSSSSERRENGYCDTKSAAPISGTNYFSLPAGRSTTACSYPMHPLFFWSYYTIYSLLRRRLQPAEPPLLHDSDNTHSGCRNSPHSRSIYSLRPWQGPACEAVSAPKSWIWTPAFRCYKFCRRKTTRGTLHIACRIIQPVGEARMRCPASLW